MTKKHFVQAAKMIKEQSPQNQRKLCNFMVEFFEVYSKKFDRDTFIAACGVSQLSFETAERELVHLD